VIQRLCSTNLALLNLEFARVLHMTSRTTNRATAGALAEDRFTRMQSGSMEKSNVAGRFIICPAAVAVAEVHAYDDPRQGTVAAPAGC
jgi:hypothetical protein